MHAKTAKIADQLLAGQEIQGHTAQSLVALHAKTIRKVAYREDYKSYTVHVMPITAKRFMDKVVVRGKYLTAILLAEANSNPQATIFKLVPLYLEL